MIDQTMVSMTGLTRQHVDEAAGRVDNLALPDGVDDPLSSLHNVISSDSLSSATIRADLRFDEHARFAQDRELECIRFTGSLLDSAAGVAFTLFHASENIFLGALESVQTSDESSRHGE